MGGPDGASMREARKPWVGTYTRSLLQTLPPTLGWPPQRSHWVWGGGSTHSQEGGAPSPVLQALWGQGAPGLTGCQWASPMSWLQRAGSGQEQGPGVQRGQGRLRLSGSPALTQVPGRSLRSYSPLYGNLLPASASTHPPWSHRDPSSRLP